MNRKPPPRSVYRKIQLCLVTAADGKPEGLERLATRVIEAGHVDFTRFQATSDGTMVVPCSRESVDRVLALCQDLALVSREGGLTREGRKALREGGFDSTLADAVMSALERLGVPMQDLRRLIRKVFREEGASLPTTAVLVERLLPETGGEVRHRFETYLSLLGGCGALDYSRRKIFLP